VQAICWWDLTDLDAWKGAPAGLLRKDNSPKPAYERLRDLIRQEWWSDMRCSSDGNGSCAARVFLGDYEITSTDADGRSAAKEIVISEDKERSFSPIEVQLCISRN
jgi:hypothetical protein